MSAIRKKPGGKEMKKEVNRISKWIKNYVKQSGARGVVVGLSGGIDSCTVAALAVKALGADNVRGVTLPCESHKEDKEDAMLLANHLGISVFNIDLTGTLNAFKKSRKHLAMVPQKALTIPNVKARLRMTTLYSIASDLGYLVLGTGNKSEYEIGYYTKYGDGGVDIEPMNNYYKTEIWAMAKELGLPVVEFELKAIK
jgi:NAD+ synthase